jgi:hypothetical protein
MAVVVGAAVVTTTAVGEVVVVGGHRRSSVGSSPVRWLLRIMPLLFRTLRRPMHRHRSMGRGGGVTPRNLITPTHKLAPAGSEPFSHGETETETRVTRCLNHGPSAAWGASAHPRPDSPAEEGFELPVLFGPRAFVSTRFLPHGVLEEGCPRKSAPLTGGLTVPIPVPVAGEMVWGGRRGGTGRALPSAASGDRFFDRPRHSFSRPIAGACGRACAREGSAELRALSNQTAKSNAVPRSDEATACTIRGKSVP